MDSISEHGVTEGNILLNDSQQSKNSKTAAEYVLISNADCTLTSPVSLTSNSRSKQTLETSSHTNSTNAPMSLDRCDKKSTHA